MLLLFIIYVKARRVVDASCPCLPAVVAATGRFWLAKSFGNPSLYLWLSFPHGGTGEDSDGSLLSLAAEAMFGVFSGGCVAWNTVEVTWELCLDGLFLEGPWIIISYLKSWTKHNLILSAPLNISLRRLCPRPPDPNNTLGKLRLSLSPCVTSLGGQPA